MEKLNTFRRIVQDWEIFTLKTRQELQNNVTVSQNQQTITIDSVDTDTITRLATGNNAVLAGDFKFVATGATSISQNTAAGVTTFTITSVNDDTGASLTASSAGRPAHVSAQDLESGDPDTLSELSSRFFSRLKVSAARQNISVAIIS